MSQGIGKKILCSSPTMGKISSSEANGRQRHNPLYADISEQGGILRQAPKNKKKKAEKAEETFLDAASSRKILQLAQEQQEEIEYEENGEMRPESPVFGEDMGEESEEDDDAEYSDFGDFDEEEYEVDEKDAALFEKYLNPNGASVNLADAILAKIQEKQEFKEEKERPQDGVMLPPKVIMAYEKIGQILATYRHGKLPKLFKVLPSLKNWEDVLYVTNPEQWTPHAIYEATKLFVSNLPAHEAQKFVEQVLLERFRVAIEELETHTLNYHLYRALKKSLYKPAAFFKGFLFPLVDTHCSVREATIAASVLAKVSVPVLHSSVALSQLLQRDFKPSTTVFIRVMIEKRYALPYQTLDELVFYFMRFRRVALNIPDKEPLPAMPLVWHKAFLAFAQRYKNDITDDQRDFLLETVRQRFHSGIGPEIRRELLAGTARVGSVAKEQAVARAW